MGDAELGLHRDGAGRKCIVGRRGREHDQVDRLRVDMGVRERGARRMRGHLRGQFAGRGNAALVDAGALHDPFVGRVDLAREIVVGEDLARQIAAAAENDRTANTSRGGSADRLLRFACACRAERRRDLGQQLVADHAVAEFDRGGEAFGIGRRRGF